LSKKKNRERTAEEIRKHNSQSGGEYWKRQPKNKGWDTMSFEEREALRQKKKEGRVYTKSFNSKQKFGPASKVRHIDSKLYKSDD
jgi:hypothetical protein